MMDAEVSPELMSRSQFQPFVDLARQACARWDVPITGLEGSTSDLAIAVRSALQKAALVAADSEVPLTYAGDTPALVGSLPGLSLDSLRSDIVEGANYGDEWGICFRVVAGDVSFDVPLVFGLDEDSASSVLAEIDGREHEFVCVEDIAIMADTDSVTVRAHADSWRYMKNLSKDLSLDLVTALPYRRPGAWDLLRGEMTQVVPRTLPMWSEADFQARYLLSVRYDMDNMAESREMLRLYSAWTPEPFSAEWNSWFPQVTDLLHAIGSPRPLAGMSVVMHFSVEEENGHDWEPVNARNVVVACGLDPVQAYTLLEFVRQDPHPFYDLPDAADKRFTLLATSAMPDAMLASSRVTSSGRSSAYDRLVDGMTARADAAEMAEIDD